MFGFFYFFLHLLISLLFIIIISNVFCLFGFDFTIYIFEIKFSKQIIKKKMTTFKVAGE